MKRWGSLSVLILALTAISLYAFPTATISYAVTVLLHTGLGVVLTLGLVVYLFRGIGRYWKFQWFNTEFAFGGVPDATKPQGEHTPDYDDRKFAFSGSLSDVSSNKKEIPNLPIIVLAEDMKPLNVLPYSAPAPGPTVEWAKEDWTRWNDHGIGLFLQGDCKGAEQAFTEITQMAPDNADGWTNAGRVRVQEGNTEGALVVLKKALELTPGLPRANFFYARVLKEEGNYDEAAKALQEVLAQYPQDRGVHDELGPIFFLQKRYADAVKELELTLASDPEDLQENYNLILCYTGLGDDTKAEQFKERYLRFKVDEASQALTGSYRQAHPEDNNERQAVHEHVSVALGPKPATKPAGATASAKQRKPFADAGR